MLGVRALMKQLLRREASVSNEGGRTADQGSDESGSGIHLGVRFLVVFLAITILLATVLWVGAATFSNANRPETVLTLLLIFGVVALLVTLAVMVTLLRVFGLTDPSQPLGLPEGSIRAVIALTLILVFAIMSVFLYWDAAHPETTQSTGLTGDILNMLPSDRVIAVTARSVNGATVYDVTTTTEGQTSNQLGLQLVTIVGTLVTALAAFYFGANSVKSAQAAATRTVTGTSAAPATGGDASSTTSTAPAATASASISPGERSEAG
jgi:hypothetical protein